MNSNIKKFIESNKALMYETLKELCLIPAPSHMEHKRAEYCRAWLEKAGAKGVYIDSALNTIFPLNCEGSNRITVFAAHTDTVFPDTEPMPYYDDGEKIYCPGVSDDTASVVVLMMMAKFFAENSIIPENGIIFVCNSCEEGLGNLKGTRQLFSDYEGRIANFITFDSDLSTVNDRCVGSHRYRVEVLTEGGHSYSEFGNDNAIEKLAELVREIYSIKPPEKEGVKTTYNVGSISGGTSVNTIAQSAQMLCEYRSGDRECLKLMQNHFDDIFKNAATDKIRVNATLIGDRPCSCTEQSKIEKLKEIIVPVIENVLNQKPRMADLSTDCNIPLSLGIPALCIGVNNHGGMHTREEWLEKSSLVPGLEIAIKAGLAMANNDIK